MRIVDHVVDGFIDALRMCKHDHEHVYALYTLAISTVVSSN